MFDRLPLFIVGNLSNFLCSQDDQSIAVPSRVDTYFLEETDADILSLYNCWRSTSAPIYHLGNIGTNQTSDLKDTLPWNKKTRGFGTASRVDGQCTVLMHLMQRFWLLGWRGTQAMDHSYKVRVQAYNHCSWKV